MHAIDRAAGFANAVNLDGDIEAWACEIDRSMPQRRIATTIGASRGSLSSSIRCVSEKVDDQVTKALFRHPTIAIEKVVGIVGHRKYPNVGDLFCRYHLRSQ